MSKKSKTKKIFVLVDRGVAEVVENTVPTGYVVEVVDLDNIRAGDSYPSAEAARCVQRLGIAP